ncbi:peptidoglycan-binding domain-containing protein [Chachezhania antarctica]|uniref:peptidoglycan-binding domain-containing protein n=1 Tax=Chachezhania antarctica TaxID=2340860 RepID=UPI000EAF45B1|nr:peptidoglycan-binding domain-containing protein [Chachezhania antarctica]|tara:strand:- start:1551 stop:2798 length:1248 start_codon:yes stop_codon:yes gene_type:complete
MRGRSIFVAAATAVAITVPAPKARAGDELAIAGGLIIGGLIVNEVVKQNRRKAQQQAQAAYYAGQQSQQATTQSTQRSTATSTPRKTSPSISSAQRTENRQVQTALNFFGFDAGTVDGVLGQNSRSAVSRYQAEMNDPSDGTLTDSERQFLLSSYQRARASGGVARYDTVLAEQGPTALLRLFRDERDGVATPVVQASAGTSPEVTRAASTVTMGTPAAGSKEITLIPLPVVRSEACDTARSNGALEWQHCVARNYAIAETAPLEAAVTNLSKSEIEAHCEGISAAMAPFRAELTGSGRKAVVTSVSEFLASSGMPTEQAVDTGQVCLGVGYRTDDPEMTLGSALLLVGAGEDAYAEIVGHHLRDGSGVASAHPRRAARWFDLAIDSADSNEETVLGQTPDRMSALRADMSASVN